jgi:RimJ/RimL family protein N-acetyltransferase
MINFFNDLLKKKDFSKIQRLDNLFTKRLSLKLMQKDDVKDMIKFLTQEITENLGGGMNWPFGQKDGEYFLNQSLEAREKNNYYNYVIRDKNTNEFIGMITPFIKKYSTCLFPGKIAYWTAENQRQKGYILEALEEIEKLYPKFFNLNKIWTTVRADNPASSNLLRKSGYIETGSKWETYNNFEAIWENVFEKNL